MESETVGLKEFNGLYREIDELYREIAKKQELSDSAFIILYNLWDFGDGCLQRDICKAAFISKQTIHSAIRKLEEQGILYLKPGKGREMHIYLTEKGTELVKEKIVPVVNKEEEAYEKLTPEERQELFRLTSQYVSLFREKVKEL